jgi:hypothetical protein
VPAIREHGDERPVELPMGQPRARGGRTLSDADVRRYRDMLAKLLIDGAGCTMRDAHAVLASKTITPLYLSARAKRCPVPVREILFAIVGGPQGGADG